MPWIARSWRQTTEFHDLFWAIYPGALARDDTYLSRAEALIEMMFMHDDVRLPGHRRGRLAEASQQDGVDIPDALIGQLKAS
jgi:(2R)-3-sulfolactate dehydrogenase (NADP+)